MRPIRRITVNLFESEINRLNLDPTMKRCVIELRQVCMEGTQKPKKQYLYHRANPFFRKKIQKEGLKPKVGESYELYLEDHFPRKKKEPLIFLFDDNSLYDSCYDDDLIRIDMNYMNPSHISMDPGIPDGHTFTYDLPIPLEAIEFLYEGSGDPDIDGARSVWRRLVQKRKPL